MERVLVAGGSGALGTAVAAELKARERWVRALVRDPERMRTDVDEIFVGDLLDPGSLAGVCDGVDAVFSCAGAKVGFTGLWQGGRRTFQHVDDWGNRSLLAEAARARVRRFGYVSVYGGRFMGSIEYIRAHESFAAALRASGLDYLVVRPTGFFTSYRVLLAMARRGRAMLFGDGSARTNPIHEADLAAFCADALEGHEHELDVGGPIIHTRLEMVELAFRALGREPRVRRMGMLATESLLRLAWLAGRHNNDFMSFAALVSTTDAVAPANGTRTLAEYFRELA